MSQVWRHSTLKGADLLMLLAIADNANDDGIAWPGYKHLASKTRIGERAAKTAVSRLLQTNELELVEQGGGTRSNVYRVKLEALHGRGALSPLVSSRTPEATGEWGVAVSDANERQTPPPPVSPATPEPSSQPSSEPSSESTAGADEPPALFAAPAEPASPSPAPANEADDDVATVWAHYVEVFGTDHMRIKELTPARATAIRKAIKATNVELCCAAIDGLKSYRTKNPQGSQDISLGAIFETRPGGRNLTDQIEFWASQADVRMNSSSRRVPLDLSGVSAVFAGQIKARRLDVVRYHRTENPDTERRVQENIAWLREHAGWEPYTDDEGKLRWRYVDGD